jgi:hypothetical protein
MQALLDTAGINLKLKNRVGSKRSYDGVVFDIGDGKVAKFVFPGRGGVNNMDNIRKEYVIQKKMSIAGLGPKTYDFIDFTMPTSFLKLQKLTGITNWPDDNINLFSNYMNMTDLKRINHGAIIIMENLYSGPDVKTALTLEEMYRKKMPIPIDLVAKAVVKMNKLGIAHNDLHWNNIMVQIKTDGTERVVIIDFGRSAMSKKQFNNVNRISGVLWRYAGVPSEKLRAAFRQARDGGAQPMAMAVAALSPPAPLPASNSYEFVKVGNSYRMRGAGGRPKKVNLPVAKLRQYAANKGIDLMGAKLKKNILQRIGAALPVPVPARVSTPVPVPVPNSYGIVKVGNSYRMRGAGGRPKKVNLPVAKLRQYAANKGIDLMGAKLKKNILQRIAAARPPVPTTLPHNSSLGFVIANGTVKMRGERGLIKPTKMKVANLKEYAAKRGIDLMGAKLKKNILQRIAKK